MLADAIHLRDRRARAQQRPVHRLLVRQRQPFRRQRQQGRAAARNQAQQQIVGAQVPGGIEDARRRRRANLVGDGMGGLDDLDPAAIDGVAIGRQDEAGKGAPPVRLDRPRHGGRGLAGAEHDGPAPRRLRQMGRDAAHRIDRADGGIEEGAQKTRMGIIGSGRSPGAQGRARPVAAGAANGAPVMARRMNWNMTPTA